MTEAVTTRHTDWALRPWTLAALLGVTGLLVHFATDWDYNDIQPWRAALAGFVFFGPLALAFTLDRDHWKAPLAFALLVGAVMAGIAWRVARAEDHYADEGYWLAAAIVSIALALPLFQAGFHKLRWRTSYDETHFHVWTDAITAAGALAFFGLSFLLANLLGELFAAIEIDLLRELLRQDWFNWMFAGVAFGAALGVLRNQLKVIGTLQSVVMLVFSLIAVPFAAALLIFILAVLVSFVLTSLALLGFWYRFEFAQAIFLLAFPLSIVGMKSLAAARAIERRLEQGDRDADTVARMLARHRFWVQVIGMMAITVTAFYGMLQNFHMSVFG